MIKSVDFQVDIIIVFNIIIDLINFSLSKVKCYIWLSVIRFHCYSYCRQLTNSEIFSSYKLVLRGGWASFILGFIVCMFYYRCLSTHYSGLSWSSLYSIIKLCLFDCLGLCSQSFLHDFYFFYGLSSKVKVRILDFLSLSGQSFWEFF